MHGMCTTGTHIITLFPMIYVLSLKIRKKNHAHFSNYKLLNNVLYYLLLSTKWRHKTYYRKQPPTHPHDVKIIFPVQYQPHIKEFSLNHIPDTYIKNTNENYFLNTIKWFSKPFYCYSPAPKAQWSVRSYCTREVPGSISGDDTQFVIVVCWRGSLSLVKKTD